VVLMGGGALIAGAIATGLVDVLSLHLAPVLLGGGTPLFPAGMRRDLRQTGSVATSTATHLTYDVL
jgi:dihydrofolate reductase